MNIRPKIEDNCSIAIVVVGYNRLKETKRLLDSLQNAYYGTNKVPLIISIDASGNTELYDYARSFVWAHGNKYVNIQEERLGLKEHIFQCGDLANSFKGIIILEDDLFVSPYFYQYAQEALDYYKNDELVAGISLYSPTTNALAQLPFVPMQDGNSVYAYQDVASWGELFNSRMWSGFRRWLKEWDQDFDTIDMPKVIKTWTKAWSKFFYAYMIETNHFFLFPHVSLTTNFNDSQGEHGEGGNPWTQYSLLMGPTKYIFAPCNELVRYDVYCHNYKLYEWLGLTQDELEIDLFGTKKSINKKHYQLSVSVLPYKLIKNFALSMRPIELNIKYQLNGKGIFLYDTSVSESSKTELHPYQYLTYMLQGFNPRLVFEYSKRFLTRYIKNKLFR
jgi:hypothetical protein